jgi:hypothetical protein
MTVHNDPPVAGYVECQFCGKFVPAADDPQLAPVLTAAMVRTIIQEELAKWTPSIPPATPAP